MKVVALKAHNVDGSNKRRVGEVYEVRDGSVARLLVKLGYVQLHEAGDDRRHYKRKDLRAED